MNWIIAKVYSERRTYKIPQSAILNVVIRDGDSRVIIYFINNDFIIADEYEEVVGNASS